jgi:hypothetical protein
MNLFYIFFFFFFVRTEEDFQRRENELIQEKIQKYGPIYSSMSGPRG